MKKSQADPTTAKSLEDKFERGEDVLDYFDVRKAPVIQPQSKGSATKRAGAYPAKGNSERRVAVREKAARYRKKT